jgi:hypothetical protein
MSGKVLLPGRIHCSDDKKKFILLFGTGWLRVVQWSRRPPVPRYYTSSVALPINGDIVSSL